MRLTSTCAIAAAFWLTFTGVGLAQSIANGQEIQVNPQAAGSGMLLYPGERGGPIELHMPGRHRFAARTGPSRSRRAATAPKPEHMASAAPPPKPKPEAKPKPERMASAPPKPAPQPNPAANPFGGAADLSHVFGGAPTPVSAPPRTAPAGPVTGNENLTKRSVILFAKDAPDPAQGALGALKFLAGDLNAAMASPNARVELQAFGGNKGDKGSDARRLSLKRALSIRQVLIDDGVSADRIDVRAMGGADDSGPADRVDVYVKA